MARVLIIDDEPIVLRALRRELCHLGHEVTATTSSAGLCEHSAYDCAILDLELVDETGVDCARLLRRRRRPPRVMFHSNTSNRALRAEASTLGVVVDKGNLEALRCFVAA